MRVNLSFMLLAVVACARGSDGDDTARAADTVPSTSQSTAAVTDSVPTQRGDSGSASSANVLTAEGWGPVRIGMTRAQVVAAAGPDANPNAVGGPDPESCEQFRPRSAPQGLLVMIERDTLTRISLSRSAAVSTDAGFAVGDSAASVVRHYGARAAVTPHKYQAAPAKYITIWTRGQPPGSSARGMVYEIGANDRIIHIHAGGPSIQYVEGCL